jgi:opacity protein-like surface antigen
LVLLTATIAAAQEGRPAAPPPLDNGYMTGAMGASFSDAQAATFGVEIGETLHPRVQAYAAFNYFDDLFNDQASSDLTDLATYLTRVTGDPWEFSGRDRGLLFSGGARYLLSQGPTFRPYVGGGPGVLNLQRMITERTLGDVSDPVLVVFGAPDGFIDAREESTFRATAEFIAGVGIASGRAYVDVGYRFRKVFHVESFTFSQFTVGVGMRF